MHKSDIFYVTEKYTKLTDEEIIKKIRNGEEEALSYLINKYIDLVNMKVSKYFIIGAEKEDIAQEGMIGLYKAIKTYNSETKNSFKTFANMCIERQIITAIKTSNRQKHLPLNSYLSLNLAAYDNNEENGEELINKLNNKVVEDPLDTIMKEEHYKEIESAMDEHLSKFERKVLDRFIKGESYINIAQKLDAPVKSVDNAIQRIRKKAIKNIFGENN